MIYFILATSSLFAASGASLWTLVYYRSATQRRTLWLAAYISSVLIAICFGLVQVVIAAASNKLFIAVPLAWLLYLWIPAYLVADMVLFWATRKLQILPFLQRRTAMIGLATVASAMCYGVVLKSIEAENLRKLEVLRAQALADLEQHLPNPSTEENAANLYVAAIEMLYSVFKDSPELERRWKDAQKAFQKGKPTAEQLNDIQTSVEKHQEALSAFQDAAAKPLCRFTNVGSRENEANNTKLLKGFQLAAALLQRRAELRCDAQDWQGALRDVQTLQSMSRHISHQPNFVFCMLGQSTFNRSCGSLRKMLVSKALTEAELKQWPTHGVSFVPDVSTIAFKSELADTLPVFGKMGEAGTDYELPPHLFFMELYWRAYLMPGEVAKYRELINAAVAVREPYFKNWSALFQNTDPQSRSQRGFAATLVAVGFESGGRSSCYAESHSRLVELSRAVCLYRAKTGVLPDSLNQLVPQYVAVIPLDPFSGEPLRMVKSRDGITLYSVSADLIDDGGVQGSYDDMKKGDIVFRIAAHPSSEEK